MKTSINNRKDNVEILASWIRTNGLDFTSVAGRAEIIERFTVEDTKRMYPNREETSRNFKNAVKFKKPAVMRALQLLCKAHGISHTIGYVYLITNPAFPGWVKIGASIDAETRLNQYQTYSPNRDYKIEYYVMCMDYISLEDKVLRQFPDRSNEWVNADIGIVKRILESSAHGSKLT